MSKIFLAFVYVCLFCLIASAQCLEPVSDEIGKTLVSKNLSVKPAQAESEVYLELTAFAANSSWLVKDAESAVLSIFVDGKYHQDVVLFAGAENFTYRAFLGKLATGKREIKAVFNEKRSAKNIGAVTINSFAVKYLTAKNEAEKLALSNAPILYLRPDTIDKFSDIPLVTYYEILPQKENGFKIRYTTVFTNEDGGTQTAALMARWGRATDIEWVYEIAVENGEIVSEIYQGANHETKNFAGKRLFGNHPVLYDVTVNNNFADAGCSDLRVAQVPIYADLSKKSRETVMDENPWTYRIMAQELMRENRVDAKNLGSNTIADLRDYVYAEIQTEPQNAGISIQLKTPDGEAISSDDGKESLRVARAGFVRIALRMDETLRGKMPDTLTIGCYANSKKTNNLEPLCKNLNLIKVVRLDEKFRPFEINLVESPKSVKAGGKISYNLKAVK